MAVTPNRRIVLELDGPAQSTVLRPNFRQTWAASDTGKMDSWVLKVLPDGTLFTIEGNNNVLFVPGDAWALEYLNQLIFAALTGDFPGAIQGPSGFTVAPNMKWYNSYRPPTDLPGAGGGGFTTTAPALRKRVPAGQAWNHADNMLAADQAAYPPPIDPDYPDHLPVDRVLVSNVSYEENMGFILTFGISNEIWGAPTFLRFYFGGSTPQDPITGTGGEFCLTLRGNGQAILYERGATNWQRRMVFFWAEPNSVPGGSFSLAIWPMCRDRLLFVSRMSSEPGFIEGAAPPPSTSGSMGNPAWTLFRDTPGQTGHQHQVAMTGIGPTRLDLRRDYRQSVLPPWLMKFPLTGVIRDQPFVLPYPPDANTPIALKTNGFGLYGATISPQMYNASTGVALGLDAFGRYLAHQSQTSYFVVFEFFAGGAAATGNQTPVLLSYEVQVDPAIVVRETIPIEMPVRDGSVTGPDIQPGHGSASVNIRDRKGTVSILRKHDRRYARLRVDVPTTGPSGDPRGFVIIHEGESWQSRGQLRGRSGLGNLEWWNYQVSLIDMWLRIEKQQSIQWLDYAVDPDVLEVDVPWVIMAVIRDVLYRSGIPYDEIDAPGWDDPDGLRLFWSPEQDKLYYGIQPKIPLGPVLKRLAFDMLGKVVIRDPNVGTRGMWRVLSPPQPATGTGDADTPAVWPLGNSLANIYVKRPAVLPGGAVPPYVVEDEGSLDTGAPPGGVPGIYVKDESYFVYPQAPEGTYLGVTGTAQLFPNRAGNQGIFAYAWNPASFNMSVDADTADPDSISYMDRLEPIFLFDPALVINPDAANYLAARISRLALNGRLWCEFTAPAIFVTNENDDLLAEPGGALRRRPLRVYDQVTLHDENGVARPVMLRNVNLHWQGARIMWMYCQGLFLDTV